MMSDAEFQRWTRLVTVQQDLVTPIRTILDYLEILCDDVRRLALPDVLEHLDKATAAARCLDEIVGRLLDSDGPLDMDAQREFGGSQAKLRHELRTPLNAIIGYGELALEDLPPAPAAEKLRPELEKLLGEARRLIACINALGKFGTGAEPGADDPAQTVIADLFRTLHPDRPETRGCEVGRILVVDDNEANRDLLRRRLLQEGHQVELAQSGRQALQMLEKEEFDLILLDLIMPGMNGIEVLERLKSDQRLYQVPVVMISGLSETDAVIRCIEAGAEDYLPKPFNLVLLRARINACLERRRWRGREQEYLAKLKIAKDRSEALLRNILPDPIVLRLNEGETIIADRFEQATILFADIVDFTPAAAKMAPAHLVGELAEIFSAFDDLALRLGVEKIKTIGDAYMAATGLPSPRADHVEVMAEFALGALDVLGSINRDGGTDYRIRIGIHTGPVVAGIIGRHKFIYDVWGDTVNIASRLESHGAPNRIQVSEPVRNALAHRYEFEPQGALTLKGRGQACAFLLVPRQHVRC
ncbi:adenylate/guanylate cyclase domain-containing protein [Rhodoligotrophos defluvii]|uniref:adenylate/guanylate cyclase domain-containing protein n=1 Tax=Rhodoligotrophos defluvii TaxID=2561934 RepID=UPI0014851BCD|nr:adenylate/guanylate cyclase domain-containing protein [Rhodoligotrophos defluvii]